MLTLLGCNHNSAPIALRERLAFPADGVASAVERLMERPGILEAFVLSTCNRVELLVRTADESDRALDQIRRFLVDECGVTPAELSAHTFHAHADEAVKHLFSVASGLDSMILGEPQILGQVKRAMADARRGGGVGTVFGRLFQQCLTTAKRVRTETGIGRHAVSVGYAAARLAEQIFGRLAGRRVLLVGAGKMADLVARHLVSGGVDSVVVCSRTYNNAVRAAERFDGRAVSWDELGQRLGEVDIVITATGATQPVLDRAMIAGVTRRRRGVPLLIVDIAVPRDVEPAAGELDGVYLYDIDGLQQIVDSSREERRRAASAARHEIERDVDAFRQWRRERDLAPAIVALRSRFETIAQEHLARYGGRLGALAESRSEELERLLRGLARKLVHGPLVELRRSAAHEGAAELLSLYERIFDLDFEASEQPEPAAPEPATGVDDSERSVAARAAGHGIRGIVRGGRSD